MQVQRVLERCGIQWLADVEPDPVPIAARQHRHDERPAVRRELCGAGPHHHGLAEEPGLLPAGNVQLDQDDLALLEKRAQHRERSGCWDGARPVRPDGIQPPRDVTPPVAGQARLEHPAADRREDRLAYLGAHGGRLIVGALMAAAEDHAATLRHGSAQACQRVVLDPDGLPRMPHQRVQHLRLDHAHARDGLDFSLAPGPGEHRRRGRESALSLLG